MILVLGAGFCGTALCEQLPALGTHRKSSDLRFNLEEPTTWNAPPNAEIIVWTFAIQSVDLAISLFEQRFLGRTVVVYGSTSAYTGDDRGFIDETSPLDFTQARVIGEEALRERGATILRLAGLWGNERDPRNWLKAGRISAGNRWLNLIHRDDVVAITRSLLESPAPGDTFIASDGHPRRWNEHLQRLSETDPFYKNITLPDGPSGLPVSPRSLHLRMPDHRWRIFPDGNPQ